MIRERLDRDLQISEGEHGIFGKPETMRPCFIVTTGLVHVATFETREEAEAFVADYPNRER